MTSESGQASVEWVALVLLVALGLGAVVTRAREVEGRPLGDELAGRILGVPERRGPRVPPVAASPALQGMPLWGGSRELLRTGARRLVGLNGLACYLRKSTAREDTNRIGDDVGDAVNCLNPISGWTGDVRGTDDG